jgi:hypothetical protein
LLVVAAGWAFADAVAGHSFVQRASDLTRFDLAWVVGALLLAGTAALVAWPGGGPVDAPLPAVDEDGQRRGIPFIQLTESSGEVTSLPALAMLRPVLLVALSPTCAPCAEVSAVIGDWPEQVPEVDVRVVTGPGLEPLPQWPGAVLVDPEHQLRSVLGMYRPSAILLGADALVAAGRWWVRTRCSRCSTTSGRTSRRCADDQVRRYAARSSSTSRGSNPVERIFASESAECAGRGARSLPAPYSSVLTGPTSSADRPEAANTARAKPAQLWASPPLVTL